MTHDRSESINGLADWVLVIATHCFHVSSAIAWRVLSLFKIAAPFPCVGKILETLSSQISSICSR